MIGTATTTNMMIMASSKSLITSSNPRTPPPKLVHPLPPKISTIPKLITTPIHLPKLLSTAAAASILAAAPLPAMAAEIEKAALFDFNLTLPTIMVEFLVLMVALDKVYFSPLGKFMDERDAAIKEKLGSVKDTSGEVKELEEQAAAVMRAARAEIAAALNQMKKETTEEVEAKLAEGKRKVEEELAEALVALEKQKEDTIKALDSQISALSKEIVKKVLPV
ncbi:hypothetical protein Sjap_011137 [Stephania japonica]|uniref:ATP synthase subunit b', chloroplastic n=1 Tax=Stephania japonica TaxID=461633 RepID=A0AAP0JCQ8_9MAGN